MKKKKIKCPSNKTQYKTLEEAHFAVNRIMDKVKQGEDRNCSYLRSYKCEHCSSWHLTSKTKTEQRARDIEKVTMKDVNKRLAKLDRKLNMKREEKEDWFDPITEQEKIAILKAFYEEDLSIIELGRRFGKNPKEVNKLIVDHNREGYN